MDLAAGERRDRGLDLVEALGPRLHQDAGDLAAGRRDDAVRREHAARDQGAAIDGGVSLATMRVLAACSMRWRAGPGGPATI